MSIKFFGEVDRDKSGNIRSEMPAWYHKRQIENMEESIAQAEHNIESGVIPPDSVREHRMIMEKEKRRLDQIRSSMPVLSDMDKEDAYRAFKSIREKVKDSHFSDSDMRRGTANAHEELHRQVDPIIPFDEREAQFLEEANIKNIKNGKIGRNDAIKLQKLLGGLLEEDVNTEVLRREKIVKETPLRRGGRKRVA